MRSAGRYEAIIQCLLSDSEQWHNLWNEWDTQLATIKQVLATYKAHDALYTELMDPDERVASNSRHQSTTITQQGTRDMKKVGEEVGVPVPYSDSTQVGANIPSNADSIVGDGQLMLESMKLLIT